ncbi:hypothetical protein PUNSTDRAFT_47554 [Punctularia strigosozonata HHB-11173 SS5]|uniref:Uncharacterized protein n=1 Tax=Punctularia strigosozonata (strain HHB-11173) TaxID=741275 RepID=R7S4U7_PUNST|nr:uncharacterized protein PUNSTDRAFT_47554 [Punctularia strigosozonata HHB-11173 SS5]EIN04286.1 hypothetical protein PUNSTDRAFT_47554 [Punctularia strigosozonata HHB-11173 SS5]
MFTSSSIIDLTVPLAPRLPSIARFDDDTVPFLPPGLQTEVDSVAPGTRARLGRAPIGLGIAGVSLSGETVISDEEDERGSEAYSALSLCPTTKSAEVIFNPIDGDAVVLFPQLAKYCLPLDEDALYQGFMPTPKPPSYISPDIALACPALTTNIGLGISGIDVGPPTQDLMDITISSVDGLTPSTPPRAPRLPSISAFPSSPSPSFESFPAFPTFDSQTLWSAPSFGGSWSSSLADEDHEWSRSFSVGPVTPPHSFARGPTVGLGIVGVDSPLDDADAARADEVGVFPGMADRLEKVRFQSMPEEAGSPVPRFRQSTRE